jgi:uncharacterized membrane protein YgaE (UPF0421/DUF939 family)
MNLDKHNFICTNWRNDPFLFVLLVCFGYSIGSFIGFLLVVVFENRPIVQYEYLFFALTIWNIFALEDVFEMGLKVNGYYSPKYIN